MKKPVFLLQIINAQTKEVVTRFGGNSPLEKELVDDIVDRVMSMVKSKSLGFWTTQKSVEKEVHTIVANAVEQSIRALKEDTIPLV